VVIAGCGGSSIGTRIVLEESGVVSKAAFRLGTVDDLVRTLGVPDEAVTFKNNLNSIARSDDPVGEALALATCQGLTQVADEDRSSEGDVVAPSAQDWEQYLNARVATLAPPYAGKVSTRVNQLNNTLQLATINPRTAHAYVEVCVRGKR
jgi:hypothetical protein